VFESLSETVEGVCVSDIEKECVCMCVCDKIQRLQYASFEFISFISMQVLRQRSPA